MSEETLRQVLERLRTDEEFRERLGNDWPNAIGELDLSPAEIAAISSNDEDALRRLVGADVTAYQNEFAGTNFICSWVCITTIDTRGSTRNTCPESKKGCGTNATHNCVMEVRQY
jgi:hypothetical protein